MPKLPLFNNLKNKSNSQSNIDGETIRAVRVVKSMLEGETNPEVFKLKGEYQSIGGIFYNDINDPNPNPQFNSNAFALPLFPNLTQVPVEKEINIFNTVLLEKPVKKRKLSYTESLIEPNIGDFGLIENNDVYFQTV